MRKASPRSIALQLKNSKVKKITNYKLMDMMAEEGLHADDDYPNVAEEVEKVGIKIVEANFKITSEEKAMIIAQRKSNFEIQKEITKLDIKIRDMEKQKKKWSPFTRDYYLKRENLI